MPIGPQNRIEPGGPDQGQPTHFLVGRGWGTTAIKVPKDFGDKKLTWTLTTNGKTVQGIFGFRRATRSSRSSTRRWATSRRRWRSSQTRRATRARLRRWRKHRSVSGAAGEAIPITVFITDDGHEESPTGGAAAPAPAPGAPATGGAAAGGGGGGFQRPPRQSVTMTKFRGPGDVKFDDNTPTIGKDGKATANATFSVPGEYVIRVEGNDSSGIGGGGFQCCWTTVYFA